MSAIVETVRMTEEERQNALARLRALFGGEPDPEALNAARAFAQAFDTVTDSE